MTLTDEELKQKHYEDMRCLILGIVNLFGEGDGNLPDLRSWDHYDPDHYLWRGLPAENPTSMHRDVLAGRLCATLESIVAEAQEIHAQMNGRPVTGTYIDELERHERMLRG